MCESIKEARKKQEFKEVLAMVYRCQNDPNVWNELKEIYEEKLQKALYWLRMRRGLIYRKILGENFRAFQVEKRRGNLSFCQQIFENCKDNSENLALKLHVINFDIDYLGPKSWTYLKNNSFLKESILSERDFEDIAYSIFSPKAHTISFTHLDPRMDEFPLRAFQRFPDSKVKEWFFRFKKGKNIQEFFEDYFSHGDFSELTRMLKSPIPRLPHPVEKIFKKRMNSILECIDCYKKKMYFASNALGRRIIDDLILDFYFWWISIVPESLSSLDKEGLLYYDKNSLKEKSISFLLINSFLKNVFDIHFLNTFAPELFLLNSNEMIEKEDWQVYYSANKLGTIRYLLEKISNEVSATKNLVENYKFRDSNESVRKNFHYIIKKWKKI